MILYKATDVCYMNVKRRLGNLETTRLGHGAPDINTFKRWGPKYNGRVVRHKQSQFLRRCKPVLSELPSSEYRQWVVARHMWNDIYCIGASEYWKWVVSRHSSRAIWVVARHMWHDNYCIVAMAPKA